MNNKFNLLWAIIFGLLGGIILHFWIIAIFRIPITPFDQLRQEVVGRGFAHWEATTNGVSIFVWHTNKNYEIPSK